MLGEEGGRAQTTRGTGGLREYTSEDREGGMEGERGMATWKRVGRNDSGGETELYKLRDKMRQMNTDVLISSPLLLISIINKRNEPLLENFFHTNLTYFKK